MCHELLIRWMEPETRGQLNHGIIKRVIAVESFHSRNYVSQIELLKLVHDSDDGDLKFSSEQKKISETNLESWNYLMYSPLLFVCVCLCERGREER